MDKKLRHLLKELIEKINQKMSQNLKEWTIDFKDRKLLFTISKELIKIYYHSNRGLYFRLTNLIIFDLKEKTIKFNDDVFRIYNKLKEKYGKKDYLNQVENFTIPKKEVLTNKELFEMFEFANNTFQKLFKQIIKKYLDDKNEKDHELIIIMEEKPYIKSVKDIFEDTLKLLYNTFKDGFEEEYTYEEFVENIFSELENNPIFKKELFRYIFYINGSIDNIDTIKQIEIIQKFDNLFNELIDKVITDKEIWNTVEKIENRILTINNIEKLYGSKISLS